MVEYPLIKIIQEHKKGNPVGIYSVCSVNRYVLEASMQQAKIDGSIILIESTSNQVDQFGGYSGMIPSQFRDFVIDIAKSADFPYEKVILGGDHLGPNVWQSENSASAMAKARDLVRSYVSAGFSKIHLDASMRCADDPGNSNTPLDFETIALRSAQLCQEAENAANANIPLYVIGTDVPIPGGAQENLIDMHITSVEEVEQSIDLTKKAFLSLGLDSAWERVIAIVVQPGLEFGDSFIIEYNRDKARELSKLIENYQNFVYETHSTDYQSQETLQQLVEDHFAILKVGPWLTFSFREAVFALADMENEYLGSRENITISQIRQVIDQIMVKNQKYWRKHYQGNESEIELARKFSYSDRIRYYWPDTSITTALNRLIKNLTENPVPLNLLSQYMPSQYYSVRQGHIKNTPLELIRNKIMEVTQIYAYATNSRKQDSLHKTLIKVS